MGLEGGTSCAIVYTLQEAGPGIAGTAQERGHSLFRRAGLGKEDFVPMRLHKHQTRDGPDVDKDILASSSSPLLSFETCGMTDI